MRYEVLEFLPPYGPMPISITDNGMPYYSAGFAVRFYRSDGTDWVGNFAPGSTKFDAAYARRDSDNILVIAGGTCYVMHPDNTSPIEAFDDNYTDAFELEDGRIVLQGKSHFTIMEPDGSHWDTAAISFWDFKDVAIQNNIITGLAMTMDSCYMDEWEAFTYNIGTKELREGERGRQMD